MHEDMIGGVAARHYRILKVLGRGGFSTVYQAIDERLQRVVVVKQFNADLANYPEAERQILREARSLAMLNHPNIIRLFEISEIEGSTYLVTEYIEGKTLQGVLAGDKPLDMDYAIEIIRQVGGALSYAHDNGIIHRDIKPSNILISNKGQVKLADFGLAISPGQRTLTQQGNIIGTPAYMSPEQARGNPLDHRSDIYSLGMVLYEMLTGRHPFSGLSVSELLVATISVSPKSLRKFNPSLPLHVERAVLKAIAKERAERYQTVDEFIADLIEANSVSITLRKKYVGGIASHSLGSKVMATSPRSKRYWWLIPILALTVFLFWLRDLSLSDLHAPISPGLPDLLLPSLLAILCATGITWFLVRGLLSRGSSSLRTKSQASHNDSSRKSNKTVPSDILVTSQSITAELTAVDSDRISEETTGKVTVIKSGGNRSSDEDEDEITLETSPYHEPPMPSTILLHRGTSAMAWLLILNGPQRGRQFRLADSFILGRAPHCDVTLDDATVSRTHSEVYLKNSRFHVVDLESPNGTFVNGLVINDQELRDRDEIRIGNTIMMFIQAVSPEDLTVEAKRRLREFDIVWEQLTKVVRHG